MIDRNQFAQHVIRPVLNAVGLYSFAGEELLLGTMATESAGGLDLVQLRNGGLYLGVFQMEPATHRDIIDNYLAYRDDLKARVVESLGSGGYLGGSLAVGRLAVDLPYAAVFCRLHYLRVPEALPAAGDIEAQARYWKRYYNTELGAGEAEDYVRAAKSYIG